MYMHCGCCFGLLAVKKLTIFYLMDTAIIWKSLFSCTGCLVFFFILFLIEIPVYANCADLDQMPHSPVIGLGLHCLPMG